MPGYGYRFGIAIPMQYHTLIHRFMVQAGQVTDHMISHCPLPHHRQPPPPPSSPPQHCSSQQPWPMTMTTMTRELGELGTGLKTHMCLEPQVCFFSFYFIIILTFSYITDYSYQQPPPPPPTSQQQLVTTNTNTTHYHNHHHLNTIAANSHGPR